MAELVSRIEAVLRRTRHSHSPALTVGEASVGMPAREVTKDREQVSLPRKEFDLLAALAREAGPVVSHERLWLLAWKPAWPGTRRTLEVHVGTLRAKLGEPDLIETVRGVGYR